MNDSVAEKEAKWLNKTPIYKFMNSYYFKLSE